MKRTDRRTTSRAAVVSSFTIIKGAMIEESYRALAAWDLRASKQENLRRIADRNDVAARSQSWLRDVVFVLSRRFDPAGRDLPLVHLASRRCPLDVWTPLLLWHTTRDEFLLRHFLVHWLWSQRQSGTFRVVPADLHEYLSKIEKVGGTTEHRWSPATIDRVAAGLLKMAVDFGLLKGRGTKEFAPYHLPEPSFLYLLHAGFEVAGNVRRLVDLEDWRMFCMSPADVEREVLRLHQFRRLEYQAAGSMAQLTLPCASARDFAQRMVA